MGVRAGHFPGLAVTRLKVPTSAGVSSSAGEVDAGGILLSSNDGLANAAVAAALIVLLHWTTLAGRMLLYATVVVGHG